MFVETADASVPFTDDFEDYFAGSIDNQGDWTTSVNGCDVLVAPAYEGVKQLKCQGQDADRIALFPLPAGTPWEFYIYNPSLTDNPDLRIVLKDADGTTINTISWISSLGNVYCTNAVNQIIGGTTRQVWTKVGFVWDKEAQTIGCCFEGVCNSYPASAGFDNDVGELFFVEQNGRQILIDYITGSELSITGYSPIITPLTPPDGATTILDLDDFSVHGFVEVPIANPNVWKQLIINYDQVGSVNHYSTRIDFDLSAGEFYEYNATSTLDNAYAYKVSYLVWGEADGYNPMTTHDVAGTYITETAAILPVWEEQENWSVPPPDDCGSMSGVEKLVCEIKNFLTGMVVPSQDQVGQLKKTIDGFKDVFPLPYLRAYQDFLTQTAAGINETSAINVSFLGSPAQQIDFSIFDFPVQVGLFSLTFAEVIRYLLGAFCLAGFGFWGLNYIQRIF